MGLLSLYFHRHLARLAIEAQEEPAPISTTKIQRSSDGIGIALEALPQLIAYAIAASHEGRKGLQRTQRTPPHPSRKGREYNVLLMWAQVSCYHSPPLWRMESLED